MKSRKKSLQEIGYGRTFVARYKRVTCNHLPANIHLRRPSKQKTASCGKRRQRPQLAQQAWGLSSILKLAKKVVKTPIVQELGSMAFSELPNLYKKGTNKIKNKKNKKMLQCDLANTLVDMGAEYGWQKLELKKKL